MKKIATLTTHGADNYGAVLQAYALQHYLETSGYECCILNYVPMYVEDDYRLVQKPKNLVGIALSAYQLLHYLQRKKRKTRFAGFRNEYLQLSGQVIRTHRELINAVNEYDAVICGSDQIWNPSMHHFDEAYFLSFANVATKRVSYAASFGQDQIDEAIKPELARRLYGFSAFACREHSAIELIKELTRTDASNVLDPVFLLPADEWRALALNPCEGKDYNLVYFLSNPGTSPFAAKRHAKENNCMTVSIGFSPRDYKYGIECVYDLGPREFLGIVDNAQIVLTNSFHCTAFSILMEKDFYVRLQSGKGSRNSRIMTLLEELGLQDRVYFDNESDKLDLSKKINYDLVRPKLQVLIAKSKSFLSNVLGS